MKIVIAGSRNLQVDNTQFNNMLQTIFKKTGTYPSTILEGGSGNIDNAAAIWAQTNLEFQQHKMYPADWNKYNKAAGPIRNQQMINDADMLILIWDGESRGSYNILGLARKKGIPVQQVVINNGKDKCSVFWRFEEVRKDTEVSSQTLRP